MPCCNQLGAYGKSKEDGKATLSGVNVMRCQVLCRAAQQGVKLQQQLSVLSSLCTVSVLTVVALSGDDNNGVEVYHWQPCGVL